VDQPPLRIGILLDSQNLSGFFARIIEDIQESNFAKIQLLVFRKRTGDPTDKSQPKSRASSLARRLFKPALRKRALYDAYVRFDERMKPANHPLDVVDCSSLLAGIESIEVEPVGKKFIHRFPLEAIERIRSKDL
jgi:hypothetical protein